MSEIDKLYAASERVAEALKLMEHDVYICSWCGKRVHYAIKEWCPCNSVRPMVQLGDAPLDLLADAGALRLWDELVARGWQGQVNRVEGEARVKLFSGKETIHISATTWPTALVLAANAAIAAGWLKGEREMLNVVQREALRKLYAHENLRHVSLSDCAEELMLALNTIDALEDEIRGVHAPRMAELEAAQKRVAVALAFFRDLAQNEPLTEIRMTYNLVVMTIEKALDEA